MKHIRQAPRTHTHICQTPKVNKIVRVACVCVCHRANALVSHIIACTILICVKKYICTYCQCITSEIAIEHWDTSQYLKFFHGFFRYLPVLQIHQIMPSSPQLELLARTPAIRERYDYYESILRVWPQCLKPPFLAHSCRFWPYFVIFKSNLRPNVVIVVILFGFSGRHLPLPPLPQINNISRGIDLHCSQRSLVAGFTDKNSNCWLKCAGRRDAGRLGALFADSASRENKKDIHATITDMKYSFIGLRVQRGGGGQPIWKLLFGIWKTLLHFP